MSTLIISNMYPPQVKELKISKEEEASYFSSREILVSALENEIIYDQIVESYFEYKNKVNYWNLRSLSAPFGDYILNHEIRSSLNRLSFNLLNLGKLYLDNHFNGVKGSCYAFDITNNQDDKDLVVSHRSEIYDSNLNYVIACELRGHSQHSALPVKSFTTGLKYNPDTFDSSSSFSIFYEYDDLMYALKDKNQIKRRISKGTRLDLTAILDEYFYAISEFHKLNRSLTKDVIKSAYKTCMTMWSEILKETGFEKYSCTLERNDGAKTSLELNWFDVHDHLLLKHNRTIDYSSVSFI